MLLARLRPYWPGANTRYIEPFCGSACLFFALEPSRAILGDLNEELIYALRVVRNDPYLVLESLRRFRGGSAGYYRLRRTLPSSLAEAERAARFLYLNRMCFNGIYRTNSRGAFNVPYGPPENRHKFDESVIVAASRVLANALLVHADFEETLERVRPHDFVYLDPPYCLGHRRVFREYGSGSFAISDLLRLGGQLRRLDAMRARFVISYADSPEARRLLRPWNPFRVRVRRHIAGFSYHRRHAYELIASNCLLEA
jgi:DNA adenine methylase